MKTIGIKDLKNNLSSYLDFVKKGETIIVYDRNDPVAEIRKYLKSENKTENYLIEASRNFSIQPVKKYKKVKISNSKSSINMTQKMITESWKSIYREERE